LTIKNKDNTTEMFLENQNVRTQMQSSWNDAKMNDPQKSARPQLLQLMFIVLRRVALRYHQYVILTDTTGGFETAPLSILKNKRNVKLGRWINSPHRRPISAFRGAH
jgi:hypothetical protein